MEFFSPYGPLKNDLGVLHDVSGSKWLERTQHDFLVESAAKVVLQHRGPVAADMIPGILQVLEADSRCQADAVVVRKRVVQVVLELLDNLARHALGPHRDSSFILVVRDGYAFRIATGNVVPSATAVLLSHRIAIMNEMGQEDLREHYLKLLANNGRSVNGGAGLGLLTMARKVEGPLHCHSTPLGTSTAYFELRMQVGLHPNQSAPAEA